MLRILSDEEDITIQTGKMEPISNLLYELARVCDAVIGTLAIDADCEVDDLRQILLSLLQEDADKLEFLGHGSGTLHVMSN